MNRINRRQFVRATALAAMAWGARGWAAGAAPKRVGLIGCGWYGKSDLFRLLQVAPVEVVSLCDVDRKMLEAAGAMTAARQVSKKTPRLYHDYRELLREKDLDIVIVGTPDHWHALPMIAAVEAGADVYLQKPISVDVREGQAMLAAARRHNRVVQVGTQRRSTPHLIEARDQIVREGRLGKVGQVEICCYYPMRTRENPPDTAPPDYLDYEMWTGPAPMRPYNRLVHPRGWRGFMEYGNGIVGDMCVHMFDMTRWMLGLGWPKTVTSSGGILVDKESKANITDTQTAIFRYDDLQVVWEHRCWGDTPDPQYPWAATFYGDKGTLKASPWTYDYVPLGGGKSIHRDYLDETAKFPEDLHEKDIEVFAAPATRRHFQNFLACIESRERPVADIEEGHISTASCILANLSQKLNRALAWDATAGQIANDDEANRLLARPYRAPWAHPTVA
ncbi:MAG TPA: Gfo/Idh/MocA family oxidoreductase [Verrucomicrobiae bacterium]|jgi:predicted dehydrogenase|nr:Gfo/Idh/MocA family oxidoreductase [Verrucomicrobiae bacterium]